MIGLIFGLFLPWLIDLGRWPWMPWVIGGALAALGLGAPMALDRIEFYWMKGAGVLGAINSRILLTIVYFAVLTPTGWLMRLFGKDPMDRKLDPSKTTYRVVSSARPRDHMDNQY